jgi:hypothetical protein
MIYSGAQLNTVGDRGTVPTHPTKRCTIQKTGESAAYIVRNDETPQFATVDLANVAATFQRNACSGVQTLTRAVKGLHLACFCAALQPTAPRSYSVTVLSIKTR